MILVAIGANLQGPEGAGPKANCEHAIALMEDDGMTVLARSRWYRSPAWPPSDQPDYINGVVRIDTQVSPEALLGRLHRIEELMGRIRGAPNAARVIDLDLLAHGGRISDDIGTADPGRLLLPHPRLQDRAFVLYPLREVAPDWTHPVSGLSVEEMIAGLPGDTLCTPVDDQAKLARRFPGIR